MLLGFAFSPIQMLIILAIVLLLFGSRLPALARSLGRSVIEFKKGIKEVEDQSHDAPTEEREAHAATKF